MSADLRWYQREAIDATYAYLNGHPSKNPLIVLPTGAGKTRVISTITNDCVKRKGRVVVVSHVKELLEQCAADMGRLCGADNVGIYSAGLNSRDTDHPIIIAGIQSIHKRANELGAIRAVIVDEAHLVPQSGDGMYLSFLKNVKRGNPDMRAIGLTATPYRLDCGRICGRDAIFQDVVYDADIRRLIDEGFLCKVVSKGGACKADLSGVHQRGGEYVPDEMAQAFDSIVEKACWEIGALTEDRKSVLLFCASVSHAHAAADLLRVFGSTGCISGETGKTERADTIGRFKAGELKYLCNVNVLTTGFDATNVDAVVLLRATQSPGLYAQMVGRGLRVNPCKVNCLVLDYGNNVLRHGPIDAIKPPSFDSNGARNEKTEAPVRECPNCHEIIPIGQNPCAACGNVFETEVHHETEASDAEILSTTTEEERTITHTEYHAHAKKGQPDAPKTLRVEYGRDEDDVQPICEWVCVGHKGYAREKALAWWTKRSRIPMPNTADEAVRIGNGGGLAETQALRLRKKTGEKFWTITGYIVGDIPEIDEVPEQAPMVIDMEDVPF